MSFTSHQKDFDQLEMLYIVYLNGRILHAVSFMHKFSRHVWSCPKISALDQRIQHPSCEGSGPSVD